MLYVVVCCPHDTPYVDIDDCIQCTKHWLENGMTDNEIIKVLECSAEWIEQHGRNTNTGIAVKKWWVKQSEYRKSNRNSEEHSKL